ncbi:MAG: hypothetical protein WAW17_11270 [Rhodococcus sp. (in: high G+C Gram-positive bacteria)]|uniref:hypothetical protein n=1 Tax=Rhodococcus sp. TaxID=1831 RepID=UPI003BB11015
MTNPDDPRTPQERAYDDTASSAPEGDRTEQWSRQDQPTEYVGPAEQRTEHLGPAEQRTEQFYTSDPTAAYGGNQPHPTQALPPYDPTFDAQQYQHTQQYPNAQYPNEYPNAQYPLQGAADEKPDAKKPRQIGTWIAATVAGLLLVGVIAFGYALFTSTPKNSSTTTAAGPTTSLPPATTAPRTTTPAPSATAESPFGQLPGGIGEFIGEAGAAFGTITVNDGATLTLDAIGGSRLIVETTPQTNVISLDGATVADLKPGSTVMVQGTKIEGGTMTAETIVSTQLPDLGGN